MRKKHQIEAGTKYTLRSHVADSQDELWDFAAKQWNIDNSNVNDLDYKQHIFAAYASYGYKFEKLTLSAGARAEYTLNRGVSKNSSGDMTFDNSNFNIVPYFNAAWQIDPKNSLSLSYTRRLGRPSVDYLNPYIFEESPYSLMHGNPELRTVVSDALTLTYRTSGETWDLTARTYGSLCGNKIEYLSKVYPDGIKVSTYENAVTYDHIDQMVSFNWNPGQRFRLQDEINTDLILRMLGTKYGANKSVYNVQINAVAQMLEAKLIRRAKVGVYEFGEPQKPVHKVTFDLWRESYLVNEPLANREDTESVIFEPYFRYLIFE